MARRKAPSATELAVPADLLPGEVEVDDGLLDDAVDELNRLYVIGGLQTALDMGSRILDLFFGGNVENYHEREKQHATYAALAEREDLKFSTSFLWYSVQVVEQLPALPPAAKEKLPLSHHRLLTHVKDGKTKKRLADKAITKGLSKRDLEVEIRKATKRQRTGATRGRKPLPAFAKGVSKIKKAIELATSELIDDRTFEHLALEDAKSLVDDLDMELGKLDVVKKKVLEQIAALEAERMASED